MIVDGILNIIYAFVYAITAVVSSFGDVSESNAITVSIINLKSYYNSLNLYLPLDTITAIVLFSLIFEGIYFTYKLIRWGYRKVPGIT
jgi:hypothetical protein